MGYRSKAIVLMVGPEQGISEVQTFMRQNSEVTPIDPLSYEARKAQHWKTVLECCSCVSAEDRSLLKIDMSWFKAYSEWDEVVGDLKSLCDDKEIILSYARMGENYNDFESETNEGHERLSIGVVREFALPLILEEYLDET